MDSEVFGVHLSEMTQLADDFSDLIKKGSENLVSELKGCWNDETGDMFIAKLSEIIGEMFKKSGEIEESIKKIKSANTEQED